MGIYKRVVEGMNKWEIRRNKNVNDFDNAKTEKHDVHYSRYIASWINAGGDLSTLDGWYSFAFWLNDLGLTDDEIYHIRVMATNGKLELENSAREFIKKAAIESELIKG